tara:strand:- start:8278 stop:8400 length:123 start_codon:yes stop_codon:yes gene_type:complete
MEYSMERFTVSVSKIYAIVYNGNNRNVFSGIKDLEVELYY